MFGADGENVGVSLTNIGFSLLQLGRTAEARPALERAAAIFERAMPAACDAISCTSPACR